MLTVTPCLLNRVLSHNSEPLNKTGRRTRAALLTHTLHLMDTVRLCKVTDRGERKRMNGGRYEVYQDCLIAEVMELWVECGIPRYM